MLFSNGYLNFKDNISPILFPMLRLWSSGFNTCQSTRAIWEAVHVSNV